jgi:hypothetical protein
MAAEVLKDRLGRKIGEIRTNGSKQEIYDRLGRKLGYYDGKYTYDRLGRKVGSGNLLTTLLTD